WSLKHLATTGQRSLFRYSRQVRNRMRRSIDRQPILWTCWAARALETGQCPNTHTERGGCAYIKGDQRPVRVAIQAAVGPRLTIRIVASPSRIVARPSGGGIGSGGTGRQRCNSGDGARLHTDLASIVICDGCGTARTDHDRVADICVNAASNRLKAFALIDRQVAIAGLNSCGSPASAANDNGEPNR